MIRLSELCGKRVRREDGTILGEVHEVHVHHSRVSALTCGSRGLLQRFTAAHSGHRIPWEQVLDITASEILIANSQNRSSVPLPAAGILFALYPPNS